MADSYNSPAMDRRTLLQLAAASAALSACAPNSLNKPKHIAVIGAGIVGASIAYHLMLAGADVTILERSEPATRASRGTFAWVNASWAKQPRHYHSFTQQSLIGWKKLENELDIPVRWGGSLEWFSSQERQTRLAEQIAEQATWGEPARMVQAQEITKMEPGLRFPHDGQAAFSGNDGAVDPVLATKILLENAMRMGAKLKTQSAVTSARRSGDHAVLLLENGSELAVDRYVVATGADTDAVKTLTGSQLPQRSTPGVIVVTKPMARLVNRVISAPGVHIHQRSDGRMVLGEQDGAPATPAHAERLKNYPNRFPSDEYAMQHAARIMTIAEQFVPGIATAQVDDVHIGWRPLPLDGHPVIGAPATQSKAYLAIMHSGVSLAPIVGEIAAQEIMKGVSSNVLDKYRPDRNFEVVKRY